MINVVCGIISNGNKVLICRRKEGKSLSGYWEFPGGKLEPDELPEKALQRELREELGMEVDIHDHFTTVTHKYADFCIKLMAIKCSFIKASFVMSDHDLYEWVEIKELFNWELADADIPIAMILLDEWKNSENNEIK